MTTPSPREIVTRWVQEARSYGRFQGFHYGTDHVIRDLSKPGPEQEVYRVPHDPAHTEQQFADFTAGQYADEILAALSYAGVVEALEEIKAATDPDNPESYRCDDREGCLDAVQAIAAQALKGAQP